MDDKRAFREAGKRVANESPQGTTKLTRLSLVDKAALCSSVVLLVLSVPLLANGTVRALMACLPTTRLRRGPIVGSSVARHHWRRVHPHRICPATASSVNHDIAVHDVKIDEERGISRYAPAFSFKCRLSDTDTDGLEESSPSTTDCHSGSPRDHGPVQIFVCTRQSQGYATCPSQADWVEMGSSPWIPGKFCRTIDS